MHTSCVNAWPQGRTLRGANLWGARRNLARYRGTVITMSSAMRDTESRQFARELVALLQSSGWVIHRDLVTEDARIPIPVGVLVEFPGTENEAMMELGRCLWGLGFHVEGRDETPASFRTCSSGIGRSATYTANGTTAPRRPGQWPGGASLRSGT